MISAIVSTVMLLLLIFLIELSYIGACYILLKVSIGISDYLNRDNGEDKEEDNEQ